MLPVVGHWVDIVVSSVRPCDEHLILGRSQTDGTCVVVVVLNDVEDLQFDEETLNIL